MQLLPTGYLLKYCYLWLTKRYNYHRTIERFFLQNNRVKSLKGNTLEPKMGAYMVC